MCAATRSGGTGRRSRRSTPREPTGSNGGELAPGINEAANQPETAAGQQVPRGRRARSTGAKQGTKPPASIQPIPPSYVEPATAREWLGALASLEEVTAYKKLSFDLLDLTPGAAVLDLGCGIGDDARAIAARIAPGGRVTGIDAEARMIAAARRRLRAAGVSLPVVEFLVADAARLPAGDASYDAVRVDRVLQHVPSPEGVVGELRRVLKPGGRVVVAEPDWKMMALYPGSPSGGDDDHTVATIFAWHIAHTAHPLIGRRLRALLVEGRFLEVQVYPVIYATASFAVANLALELELAARAAASAVPPQLTSEEVDRWIAAARAAENAGSFSAIVPIVLARGVQPAATGRSPRRKSPPRARKREAV